MFPIISIANLDDNENRILELTLNKIVKFRLDQLNDSVNEELKRESIGFAGKKTH
jgi:hypothetical protein